jgi:hypothetical protein
MSIQYPEYTDVIFLSKHQAESQIALISEFPMMMFAAFFGFLGALVKMLLERDALYRMIAVRERTAPEASGVSHFFDESILEKIEINSLLIGLILGSASYLIVRSKFLIKLLYNIPEMSGAEVAPTGVLLFGFFVGYFSRELVGVSQKVFDARVAKFLQTVPPLSAANKPDSHSEK